jgi:hypothetical protein
LQRGHRMDDLHTDRLGSEAEVNCVLDGTEHRLSLYDLSASGCMLDAPHGLLPRGRRLVLRFLRNLAVPARIVWQRGGRVGLRFQTPLQQDLVEQLSDTIRLEAVERYAFHDRFGRPVSSPPAFTNVLASLRAERPRKAQLRMRSAQS